MNQKEVFLKSEGNEWFFRNKNFLDDMLKPYEFYERYIKEGERILEIGCSSGHNLQYYYENCKCECYGIDPSQDAIEYGKEKYRNLNLNVGTSDELNFEDGYFDYVIFGFCLYLVDRNLLLKTISEVDRVLKNKGYLAITDFDPKFPKKRPYRYVNGLNSFKMDYSKIFLSIPDYSLVDKYSFSHKSELFSEDEGERVASVILYKNREQGYLFEKD